MLHIGKEKVKLNFYFTIKALLNPPSSANGKSLMVVWKRGDKKKGETKEVEFHGESRVKFGDEFQLYLSFYMEPKSQKFDAKSLSFTLYEVSGSKQSSAGKAEINVADYGKDGFSSGKAVCLGKNSQKDPTLEVHFRTVWEKDGASRPDSGGKPKLQLEGRDFSETNRESSKRSSNDNHEEDSRNSQQQQQQQEKSSSRAASSPRGPQSSSRSNPSSPRGGATEEKNSLGVLTLKDNKKKLFHITVVSFENLPTSAQGSNIYLKWKRAAKEGYHGETRKYQCSGGTINVDEAFEVRCPMQKDKKGRFPKKMLGLQLRQSSSGEDTELIKFDLDLAPFAEEGESHEYTVKKSDKLPFISLVISAGAGSRIGNQASEADALTEIQMDSDVEEDRFANPAVGIGSDEKQVEESDEPFTKFVGESFVEYNANIFKEEHPDKEPDYNFKVIILGDSGVGKTSVLNRYKGDKFLNITVPTIGVSLFSKVYVKNSDSKIVNVGVWDTAGQERFKAVTKGYYRGAQGVVLVYDVTERKSFEHLSDWVHEVKEANPYPMTWLIIGNKADLEAEVDEDEASGYARSLNAALMETSALSNTNIHQAFERLVSEILLSMNRPLNTVSTPPTSLPTSSSVSLSPATPVDSWYCNC